MRSVRLDADLGTGFVSCTGVQELGEALRWAWCSTRIWELVSMGIKKGRHPRCLPVDQKFCLRSSFIELPADHTHQIDVPIIDPDSRTPV
jgi:hypothetical protein